MGWKREREEREREREERERRGVKEWLLKEKRLRRWLEVCIHHRLWLLPLFLTIAMETPLQPLGGGGEGGGQ